MDDGSARKHWRRFGRAAAGVVSLVYPTAALCILGLAIADLPNALRATQNDGVPGTFIVTKQHCRPWWEKNSGCTTHGDFVSDDKSVQLRGALFEGNPGKVGTVTGISLGASGYLAWQVALVVRRRRLTSAKGA